MFSVGSIPACAGETRAVMARIKRERVYPRLCGGNMRRVRQCRRVEGLSPLVRGKLSQGDIARRRPGSIPACAGETPSRCTPGRPRGVYPRLCGGNEPVIIYPIRHVGLSPLVRGKPDTVRCQPNPAGSIPACAGET